MKKAYFSSFFVLGLTLIIAQLAMIREVLISFHGNEIFIGLALGFWFIWAFIGNSALVKAFNALNTVKVLVACHFLVPFIFFVEIIWLRLAPDLIFDYSGQSFNLLFSIIYLFIVICPIGLIFGLQYAAANRLIINHNLEGGFFHKLFSWLKEKFFSRDIDSLVYLTSRSHFYQSLGLVFGGLFYYFIFRFLNPVDLFFVFAFLNFIVILLLVSSRRSQIISISILILTLVGWLLLSFGFLSIANNDLLSVQDFSKTENSISTYIGPTEFYQQNFSLLHSYYPKISNFFGFLTKITLFRLIIASIILFYITFYSLDVLVKKKERILSFITMTPEFSLMSVEIVFIFLFQIIYGSLFYNISLIFIAVASGVAIGIWLAVYFVDKGKIHYRYLIRLYFAISLYFILLSVILTFIPQALSLPIFFYYLVFMAGIFIGLEFPMVNKFYLENVFNPIKKATNIYRADLLGTGLGAIVTTLFFIPILGFTKTIIFLALINFLAFTALFFLRQNFEEN